MTAEQQGVSPLPPVPDRAPAPAEDLSKEIATFVEKLPGDVVRCRRIDGDKYRCNWWAPQMTGGYDNPSMHGLLVTTHRVRHSQFLRVTKSAVRGLVIQVVGGPG